MRTRLSTIMIVGAAAAALTACNSGGASTPTATPSITSTAGATESSTATDTPQAGDDTGALSSLQPGEEVPDGMDVHDVKVFQVAIPSEWTPEEPTGEPTLAFWGEDADGAPAEGAMVRWDPQGTSALDTAEQLEQQLSGEGTTATIEALTWPDVAPGGAYLVTFESEMAPGALRRVEQIFADLPQGGTGSVIGFAEPDAFAQSQVPAVLGSFRVAP